MNFEDRIAFVTGGGSGIGHACARLLAERGAQVVAADVDVAGVEETVAPLAPGRGRAVELDVTSPEAVEAALVDTVETFGRLDLAVNAAGISGSFSKTADKPLEEWRQVLEINLTAVFSCMRAEIRHMLATGRVASGNGAAIVNIASVAGAVGRPGMVAYAASKHGVVGLTRTAALEYAQSGLRINAVLPSAVRTPMLRTFVGGDEGVDKLGQTIPMGRAAEADEIARAVVWLCSDEASYLTGHTLAVDGGALSG